MAVPTTPDEVAAQEREQREQKLAGPAAAALATAGAAQAGLAGTTTTGALGATPPVGLALSAKQVASLTGEMVGAMLRHMALQDDGGRGVREFLMQRFPDKAPEVIDSVVRRELEYEREFQKRMRARLEEKLPLALAISDPKKRRDAVKAVLEAEERYTRQRVDALYDRSIAQAEFAAVRDASPQGAYWRLSPFVKQHTPDCVAMANKFWPWEVLDKVAPPLHHGCRCQLLTLGEAIERGYMKEEHAAVDAAEAIARAKVLLRDAKTVRDLLDEAEWAAWCDELEEAASVGGAMVAFYPQPAVQRKLARLAGADGEKAEQIHLTLVFLGDDAEKLRKQRPAIRRAVARAAAKADGELRGTVGGLGVFSAPGEDAHPVWAAADVVGLNEFRAALVGELGDLLRPENHGFTPHITLRYAPKESRPKLPALPAALPLRFDRVWLVWGGEREGFKLGEAVEEATSGLGPTDEAANPLVLPLIEARKHDPEYERETERIRASAKTPAAKARHTFRAAKWTHPNGHPRCRLCGQEEPIGGVCNGKPTRAEAEAWAERENREDAKLGMKSRWLVDAHGDLKCDLGEGLELTEASWAERYAKGTVKGGQFRPRVGGSSALISRAKRALLHELFPEMPKPPSKLRGRGRHANLDGRHVFVPEARAFERTIGGATFSSPAGSTAIFRNGRRYDAARAPAYRPEDVPELELPSGPAPAGLERAAAALRAPVSERLANQVAYAMRVKRRDAPPVALDTPGLAADDALGAAGFRVTGVGRTSEGVRFDYAAPDGASTLRLEFDDRDSHVIDVSWAPGHAAPAGRPLERPPRTWEEFTGELDAYARRTATRAGRSAFLRGVETAPEMEDHAGEYRFDGTLRLGRDVRRDVLAAAVTRARGAALTDEQKANVYRATQSSVHEALHAANPPDERDFQDDVYEGLEEALTEELSHLEAVDMLRSQGQHDVVAWAADHPSDVRVLGTYWGWRHGLDRTLNAAGVKPQDREALIRRLKLHTEPRDRLRLLGRMVADAQHVSIESGMDRVAGDVAAGARSFPSAFVPVLPLPVEPSGAPSGFVVAGHAGAEGDLALVNRRLRSSAGFETEQREGRLEDLREVGGRWLATVRYPNGAVDAAVSAGEVAELRRADDEDEGTGRLPGLRLGGMRVLPGDTVEFGAPDDVTSARVVRVVRASNVAAPGTPGWVVDATVGEQRVLLTPERAPDLRLAEAIVPAGGARAKPVGLTRLEDRVALAGKFELPSAAKVVPLASIVPGRVGSAEKRADAARRLAEPGPVGSKLPPLRVSARHDGRLRLHDDDAVLAAARERGLERLPVVEFPGRSVSRAAVVRAIRSELAAVPEGDAWDRARRRGLTRAAEIVAGGGGQPEILDAAEAHGPLHGGDAANEGFQTGMRSAWLQVGAQAQAEALRRYASGDVAAGSREEALTAQAVARVRGEDARADELARGLRGLPRKASAAIKLPFGKSGGDDADDPWLAHFLKTSGQKKGGDTPAGGDSSGGDTVFVPFDPSKLGPFGGGVVVVDDEGKRWWAESAEGTIGAGSTAVRLRPEGKPKEKGVVFAVADLPNLRVPQVTGPAVDATKLRGGEVVADASGQTFTVRLTGTNDVPTVTLKPLEGDEVTYPEAELPPLTLVKAGYGSFAPPSPPAPVWDDAHTVKTVKRAGGSTGAMFAEDEAGDRWLVKRYDGNRDRVATELLANAVYRRLGARVPEGGTLSFDGKPAYAYRLVDGELRRWDEPSPALARDFMVDALVANWDVVGLDQDNVLWDPEGRPVRIDQGGTFQFRAQGSPKPFGPVPSEVWTMARPRGQAFGTMALTPAGKRAGARAIARELTPEVVDELVDAAGFKSKKMRDEVRDALKARVAWMGDYAAGRVAEPEPLEGDAAELELASSQAGLVDAPVEQLGALQAFVGSPARVNAAVRGGRKPSEEAAKRGRELDRLIAGQRTPDDMVVYAALPPIEGSYVGKTFHDRGYLLAAWAPFEVGESRLLRLDVPKGSRLVAPASVPGVEHEGAPDVVFARSARVLVVDERDGVLHGVLV